MPSATHAPPGGQPRHATLGGNTAFFTGMDLAETLKVVRKMLEQRSIYSQLDAEQQNPTVHSGLSATRQ